MRFDFTTPEGLEITASDKKGDEQEMEDERVEGKRLPFLEMFVVYFLLHVRFL